MTIIVRIPLPETISEISLCIILCTVLHGCTVEVFECLEGAFAPINFKFCSDFHSDFLFLIDVNERLNNQEHASSPRHF